MRQAFDLFDKNLDGKISSDELGCVLRMLGHDYSQDDVDEMIKNADTNGNTTKHVDRCRAFDVDIW